MKLKMYKLVNWETPNEVHKENLFVEFGSYVSHDMELFTQGYKECVLWTIYTNSPRVVFEQQTRSKFTTRTICERNMLEGRLYKGYDTSKLVTVL